MEKYEARLFFEKRLVRKGPAKKNTRFPPLAYGVDTGTRSGQNAVTRGQ